MLMVKISVVRCKHGTEAMKGHCRHRGKPRASHLRLFVVDPHPPIDGLGGQTFSAAKACGGLYFTHLPVPWAAGTGWSHCRLLPEGDNDELEVQSRGGHGARLHGQPLRRRARRGGDGHGRASGNVYEGAVGKRELGKDQPMTTDSVFAIFSTTKALTGG